MKTGSAVCEEVKLSALFKAAQICEKKVIEEEAAIEIAKVCIYLKQNRIF
jgi:hypothetical protein